MVILSGAKTFGVSIYLRSLVVRWVLFRRLPVFGLDIGQVRPLKPGESVLGY